ncbi:hypothetical protein ACXDF8_18795 [Mycolicibacterium sp. CBM1]
MNATRSVIDIDDDRVLVTTWTFDAGDATGAQVHEYDYIVGLAGSYASRGDTDAVRAGDFTITNTPLLFEAGDLVARITFRDDRTLAGLYILDPDVAGGPGRTAAT